MTADRSTSARRSCSAATLVAAALTLLAGSAAAQTPLATAYGDRAQQATGAALAAMPDLNGDGLPDLIIGAPGDGSQPATTVGVLDAASGALLLRIVNQDAGSRFGAAVAGLPDVNGDGVPDLSVGAPGALDAPPTAGRVLVHSGADGALLLDINNDPLFPDSEYGAALAALDDLDGDGGPELFIGAPAADGAGRAFVRSAVSGVQQYVWVGDAAGDRFGSALSSAGDVDADGTPDLLVGAPGGDYARVHSGAHGGVLLTVLGAGGEFGGAVAPAGDMNADGLADIAVAAPGLDRVDVLSGADGSLLRRYQRDSGAFGTSLAPMGDVDGDGVMDFLVGAPLETVAEFVETGRTYAISGNVGTVLFKTPAGAAGEFQGAAGAVLGLVSSGGTFAVGAPGAVGPAGTAAGAARLYAGNLVGAIVPYGIGCPGTFAITPRIDLAGDPLPDGEVTLSITEALGGSFALLFLGGGKGTLLLANGCILWTDPVLLAPIMLPLAGKDPGAGIAAVTGRIPVSVPAGTVITLQALVADPDADGGISATSAIQLTVQ